MSKLKRAVMKKCVLLINVYNIIFWTCLILDVFHVLIWFFGLETLDTYNIYREILGMVSFVLTFLLVFFNLIPLEKITKIKSIQPFQEKVEGRVKWIIYTPIFISVLSLVIRLGLSLFGKSALQSDSIAIWGIGTANSIICAACILQIRWFKSKLKRESNQENDWIK